MPDCPGVLSPFSFSKGIFYMKTGSNAVGHHSAISPKFITGKAFRKKLMAWHHEISYFLDVEPLNAGVFLTCQRKTTGKVSTDTG
jgi:hypothetical protein